MSYVLHLRIMQGDGTLINDKSALVVNNNRIEKFSPEREQLSFGCGSLGGRSRGGRGGRDTHKCTHCGLKNHTCDTCWNLVGKPPLFANTVTTDQVESGSSTQGFQKTLTLSEEDYVKFL